MKIGTWKWLLIRIETCSLWRHFHSSSSITLWHQRRGKVELERLRNPIRGIDPSRPVKLLHLLSSEQQSCNFFVIISMTWINFRSQQKNFLKFTIFNCGIHKIEESKFKLTSFLLWSTKNRIFFIISNFSILFLCLNRKLGIVQLIKLFEIFL